MRWPATVFLAVTLFAVAWLRLLLFEETSGWWRWSRLHGRFLLYLPLVFFGYILVHVGIIGIRHAFELSLSPEDFLRFQTPAAALPWWLLFWLLPATIALILARIGPLYPAMVSGAKLTVKQAWRFTAGQGLRASGALMLAAILPLWIVFLAEPYVFALIDDQPEVPLDRLSASEQMLWHLYALPLFFALFAIIAVALTIVVQVYRGNYVTGAGSRDDILERFE